MICVHHRHGPPKILISYKYAETRRSGRGEKKIKITSGFHVYDTTVFIPYSSQTLKIPLTTPPLPPTITPSTHARIANLQNIPNLTEQDAGGMPTADGSRKRTAGGVFFTLLKDHMEPAKLKELYADEVRVKKENDRARRAANKRKALAALAGEDVMTPRDPPRKRAQGNGRDRDRVYDRRADGGSATRAGRNMGTWVGPAAAAGGGAADDVVAAKRARASTTLSGDGEGGVAARTLLP